MGATVGGTGVDVRVGVELGGTIVSVGSGNVAVGETGVLVTVKTGEGVFVGDSIGVRVRVGAGRGVAVAEFATVA